MTTQLRIYDIAPGRMEEFAAKVASDVIPARKKYGFGVIGPWVNEADNQYVWLVSYDGELSWDDAVTRYMSSPERSGMGWDPMDYIEKMDTRLMRDV